MSGYDMIMIGSQGCMPLNKTILGKAISLRLKASGILTVNDLIAYYSEHRRFMISGIGVKGEKQIYKFMIDVLFDIIKNKRDVVTGENISKEELISRALFQVLNKEVKVNLEDVTKFVMT